MTSGDKKKADTYLLIKLGGMLFFIPFILVVGPMAGYFAGEYLEKTYSLPRYTTAVLITMGFIGGIRETFRIIKMALRSIKK